MIIGVMSDLHDNVAAWNILKKELVRLAITTLVNCGDTCSPAMLSEMAKGFGGQIYTIFGNVADRDLELTVVRKLPNVIHDGDAADFTLENRRIGVVHDPMRAEALAKQGGFDLVCFGHTHVRRWEVIGNTYLLNPGTAGGMFQYPTFATVDLQTMTCAFQNLKL